MADQRQRPCPHYRQGQPLVCNLCLSLIVNRSGSGPGTSLSPQLQAAYDRYYIAQQTQVGRDQARRDIARMTARPFAPGEVYGQSDVIANAATGRPWPGFPYALNIDSDPAFAVPQQEDHQQPGQRQPRPPSLGELRQRQQYTEQQNTGPQCNGQQRTRRQYTGQQNFGQQNTGQQYTGQQNTAPGPSRLHQGQNAPRSGRNYIPPGYSHRVDAVQPRDGSCAGQQQVSSGHRTMPHQQQQYVSSNEDSDSSDNDDEEE